MAEQINPSGAGNLLPARTKFWRGLWMIGGVVGTFVIIAELIRPHSSVAMPPVVPPAPQAVVATVTVSGPNLISIVKDAPLRKQLKFVSIEQNDIKAARLTVGGTVVARTVEGSGPLEDRWQFNNLELTAKYSDWLKTKGEINFATSQLEKTRELLKAETGYREETLKRLLPLYEASSVPEKQVREAKADLLRAQIQGAKDVFEAESRLRVAQNQRLVLERTLSQDGIEPVVFSRAEENMVLVVANVPESRVSLVKVGQECEACFFGFLEDHYPAHVELLSASVTTERRTLRVMLHVTDEKSMLRPGMYADVRIGTDSRPAKLVPADALLRIEQKDYVLVVEDDEHLHVTEVQVGESHEGKFEVIRGLSKGEKVVSSGAILLKPTAVDAMATTAAGSGS